MKDLRVEKADSWFESSSKRCFASNVTQAWQKFDRQPRYNVQTCHRYCSGFEQHVAYKEKTRVERAQNNF